MRLFRRVGDIFSANLNDLVDRFEDPEVMLRQAIREMDAAIESATAAAARAIAHERSLTRERDDHVRQASLWHIRAEESVADRDDDLARRALARKHEHDALAAALSENIAEARRVGDDLRRRVDAMKAKHAEARRKLATLSARARTAEASKALRGVGRTGFARFERLRDRVDRAETEATVWAELLHDGGPEWEDRAAARNIEAELGAIRQRVQPRPDPGRDSH